MSTTQNNRQHESHDTILGVVVFAIIIAILATLVWMSVVSGHGDIEWYMMPLG